VRNLHCFAEKLKRFSALTQTTLKIRRKQFFYATMQR